MTPIESFTPGPTPNTVRSADGKVLTVPAGWVLFQPGDAALTRRVKAAGDHLIVQEIPQPSSEPKLIHTWRNVRSRLSIA